LARGDVESARLFYRHGAEAGDGTAALRLGETYDPAFLARAHLGLVTGDTKEAVHWYRRARELGNSDAGILLNSARFVRR
jgi:TPR repeat protein